MQKADGLLLWTDAYEESGAIIVEDGEIVGGGDPGLQTELGPGEIAAEEYEVQSDRDAFESGEFTLNGKINYRFENRRETVSYEVSWEIQEVDTDQ